MFKNFKCLIIGFGSIGKRHATLLAKLFGKKSVYIFSKRKVKNYKSFKNINDISQIDFDYIVICSPTSEHYSQIKFIDNKFKNKNILVEKPLIHKSTKLKIKNNNYFVGYNLRFHPLIDLIKKRIKKKNVFSSIINCSSFLPAWRKKRNYKNIYSSKKKMGGGVLLDLSHELDYFQYIFGNLKMKNINYVKINKISNLKVDTEDNALIQGNIRNMDFMININFFSKNLSREIILETFDETIKADLINNTLEIYSKKNKSIKKTRVKPVDTYFEQHLNILKNNSRKKACNFNEGLSLINLIDRIKIKNGKKN